MPRDIDNIILSDNEGIFTIWIAENISLDELNIISIVEIIVIAIKDSMDKLIIDGFIANSDNYVLKIGSEILTSICLLLFSA